MTESLPIPLDSKLEENLHSTKLEDPRLKKRKLNTIDKSNSSKITKSKSKTVKDKNHDKSKKNSRADLHTQTVRSDTR